MTSSTGKITGLAALPADISRTWQYLPGGRLRRLVGCCRAPGVHAVVVYRYGQSTRRWPLIIKLFSEPLYFIANAFIKILWGIELPRSAQAGPGLYIGHFGGITVSPDTKLGSNCNLSQGVTIGLGGSKDKLGVPTIGDNVFLAPGARVFGKITIGNGVKIGANAVVYRDIPDYSIAVLDPGFRILARRGLDESGESDNGKKS